jgi:hypothetical protein
MDWSCQGKLQNVTHNEEECQIVEIEKVLKSIWLFLLE